LPNRGQILQELCNFLAGTGVQCTESLGSSLSE
jgi:hypothetical protein